MLRNEKVSIVCYKKVNMLLYCRALVASYSLGPKLTFFLTQSSQRTNVITPPPPPPTMITEPD